MPTIYLVDASPYIFRAYYALPPTIESPEGMAINAVHGFADFLIQLLKRAQPTHLAIAFDGSLTTSFRNEIYPQYKAQRALPPPELEAQLDACREVAEAMGAPTFIHERFEADDIIGTLVHEFSKESFQMVVVSSDKDLTQLVGDNVLFWDFARDKQYDSAGVKEHFGVNPDQMVDLLALTGDAVDNIPGVAGIGKKTATLLLQNFSNLEEIYAGLDRVDTLSLRGASAAKQKLLAQKESAILSKQLAKLAVDSSLIAGPTSFEYDGARRDLIEPLFERLGLDSIKERIPTWAAEQGSEPSRPKMS